MNNRYRDKQFNIRLTERELAQFEKKRAASGLSKTDFVMQMVQCSIIKVYSFDSELRDLLHGLRKIGVNLNQVAYLMNTMQDGEALRELHLMYGSFCGIMNKLSAFMDKPLVNAVIVED